MKNNAHEFTSQAEETIIFSMRLTIFIFSLLLSSLSTFAGVRGEIQRFTLLHDRLLIDRQLRKTPYTSFLNIDLAISSGIKDLIADIKTGSEDSLNSVQKQLNMFQVLSKNVNTEKFIDADVLLSLPMPDIKIKKFHFYSNIFYTLNFGVMATISNKDDATNPQAQVYVRKEIKQGLNTLIHKNKKSSISLALYQLIRSDSSTVATASSLATDGKLFNFDDLKKEHKMLDLDLRWIRAGKYNQGLFEIKELQLWTMSDHKSLYGSRPMIHYQYQWNQKNNFLLWRPFLGMHYRKWYPLSRGLYGGIHIKPTKDVPFAFTGKISNQFLTIIPRFETGLFKFSYSFKAPFRNPQDDIWVAGIHNIDLNFTFF
jgi:hypothetical protein